MPTHFTYPRQQLLLERLDENTRFSIVRLFPRVRRNVGRRSGSVVASGRATLPFRRTRSLSETSCGTTYGNFFFYRSPLLRTDVWYPLLRDIVSSQPDNWLCFTFYDIVALSPLARHSWHWNEAKTKWCQQDSGVCYSDQLFVDFFSLFFFYTVTTGVRPASWARSEQASFLSILSSIAPVRLCRGVIMACAFPGSRIYYNMIIL